MLPDQAVRQRYNSISINIYECVLSKYHHLDMTTDVARALKSTLTNKPYTFKRHVVTGSVSTVGKAMAVIPPRNWVVLQFNPLG